MSDTSPTRPLFALLLGQTHDRRPRIVLGLLAILAAAVLWLPLVRFLFIPPIDEFLAGPTGPVPPRARAIANYHVKLWTDPTLRAKEIDKMRGSNAEWDFMGRTYLVLALANMALRDPQSASPTLTVIDRIIDETTRVEQERGQLFFLMEYARWRPFIASPARSVFVDGEIALMLAARCVVAPDPQRRTQLRDRIGVISSQMQASPCLSAESYPDECWTFCNSVALAAIRIDAWLDGKPCPELAQQWLTTARQKLIEPTSGLLVSSFDLKGKPLDGPEGSTIWMVVHCLQLIDPGFAADQYRRARTELARFFFGFGYAAEWPRHHRGPADIDSGPILPGLDLSAGATGLAFLGAGSFGDREYLAALLASLELGAMPHREPDGSLRYLASNQVGDAVLLYSLVQGPLWQRILTTSGAAVPGVTMSATGPTPVNPASQPLDTQR